MNVGFGIPVEMLFDGVTFAKGLLLFTVPCFFGKILVGFVEPSCGWLIGTAMVGRGEFAFLVADIATHTTLSDGTYLLSQDSYASVVWALLLCIVIAPLLFQCALNRELSKRSDVKACLLMINLECVR